MPSHHAACTLYPVPGAVTAKTQRRNAMNNELQIYRKRLIPEECILLKDDIIIEQTEDHILTKWKTLNPKTTFSHGCSCYYLKEGFKISKFYRHDGSLLYWYCDIVEYTYQPESNSLIVWTNWPRLWKRV